MLDPIEPKLNGSSVKSEVPKNRISVPVSRQSIDRSVVQYASACYAEALVLLLCDRFGRLLC